MEAAVRAKQKRRPARQYGDDVRADLCEHVANGKSALSFLRDKQISRSVLHRWTVEIPHFQELLTRARECGYDALADECLQIAEECGTDRGKIEHAKLRIETRLKLLACWDPKRYGQRIAQDNAISVTVNVVDPTAHLVTVGALEHAPQTRLIPQDDRSEHTRDAQVGDQAPEQADRGNRTR